MAQSNQGVALGEMRQPAQQSALLVPSSPDRPSSNRPSPDRPSSNRPNSANGLHGPTSATSSSSGSTAEPARVIRVAAGLCPPFVMPPGRFVFPQPPGQTQTANATDGLALRLWHGIAQINDWRFEVLPMAFAEMLPAVARGDADVAVSCISVTADREEQFDLSQPYFFSYTGVATTQHQAKIDLIRTLKDVLYQGRWYFLVLLVVALTLALAVWRLERVPPPLQQHQAQPPQQQLQQQPQQQQQQPSSPSDPRFQSYTGTLSWAVLTLLNQESTILTGTRSRATRWLGLGAILVGAMVFTIYLAAVTSALTLARTAPQIRSTADLHRVRVGAERGTQTANELRHKGIPFRDFDSKQAAVDAVYKGEIDAAVGSAASLAFIVRDNRDYAARLTVLPDVSISPSDYVFAMRPGSPLREPLNRALAQYTRSPEWLFLRQTVIGDGREQPRPA